jgi:serine kinase of HPr protein (carbohydrate metabolism regulator)
LTLDEKSSGLKLLDRDINFGRKLLKTDLYIILNYITYNAFINNNRCGIHSTIVAKDNFAILILGGFGVGKTTLALEFEKLRLGN